MPLRLVSVRPENRFSVVILRGPAKSGTTKNIEILRPAWAGLRMKNCLCLRGACPEHSEGLRMTLLSFRMETSELIDMT